MGSKYTDEIAYLKSIYSRYEKEEEQDSLFTEQTGDGKHISVENGALSINGFTSSCYVVRNRSGDVIIRSFDAEYIKEVLHWAVDEKHNPGLDITE